MNKIIGLGLPFGDINIYYEEKNLVDRFVKEVIVEEEYFRAFKDKVIIDVGANIGTFCIYAYPYAKKIYAIEPMAVNYNNLLKTISENKLDKISPYKIAIAGHEGKVRISTGNLYSDFKINGDGIDEEEVNCTTISKFIIDNNIDYVDVLKIDIEGGEVEAFSDPNFITVKNRIGFIIGEVHGVDKDKEKFKEQLENLGYRVEIIKNYQFIAK